MRLLLIEDSPRLRTTLARALTRLGHAVDPAGDGDEGALLADMHEYDAIILDLLLPGKSGLTLLESWRGRNNDVPVLILTALDSVDDRVRGLALGADDYLAKPFAIAELNARLEAITRRRLGRPDSRVIIRDLEIDFAAKQAWLAGDLLDLTAREFSLLECLARRPGQTLSREQIEGHIYSEKDSPLSNAVDAAIYSLRKKITTSGTSPLIKTRRGLGYVLENS